MPRCAPMYMHVTNTFSCAGSKAMTYLPDHAGTSMCNQISPSIAKQAPAGSQTCVEPVKSTCRSNSNHFRETAALPIWKSQSLR